MIIGIEFKLKSSVKCLVSLENMEEFIIIHKNDLINTDEELDQLREKIKREVK